MSKEKTECTMHSYRYIVMPSICLVIFVALAHMLARAAFCNYDLYCVVVVVVAAVVAGGNTDAWMFGGGWCWWLSWFMYNIIHIL